MARSAYWDAYPVDGVTLLLFHLDELTPREDRRTLGDDGQAGDDLLDAPGGDIVSSRGRNEVRGANRGAGMGSVGRLQGACELVPKAKFRGGVRVRGRDGVLVCHGADWNVGRTLEFWIKLGRLPKLHATLAHLKTTQNNAYSLSLRVRADGALCAAWHGEPSPRSDAKLAVGQWHHLAMLWTYANGTLHVSLLLNGQPILRHSVPYNWSRHCSVRRDAVLSVGNDAGGRSGAHALIDEVRLSGVLRKYYQPDLAWVRPGAEPEAFGGPPHFRDDDDLVFYLPFDESVEPERVADGTAVSCAVRPDLGDEARYYAPGVSGKGLLLGHGGLGPVYDGEGNLDPRAGTVACWVRPVAWDNYTRDNRFDGMYPSFVDLFHVFGHYPQGGAPERWRREVPLFRLVLLQNMLEFVHDAVDFQPGRWLHLAASWEKEKLKYFVDGRPWPHQGSFALVTCDNDYWMWGKPGRPAGTAWTHKSCPQTIRFRRLVRPLWHPYWHPRPHDPHTVIDEFRVYRRALSPVEVANLAALHDPRKSLRKLPAAEITVQYNGVLGYVDVEAHSLVPAYRDLKTVAFTVADRRALAPLATTTLTIDAQERAKARLRTRPLGFATYDVTAAFKDGDGKIGAQASTSFTRVKPPWWKTKAGLSDKVMPDWEPVRVEGSTVSVVLRDIHFGASGFPQKIVSVGEDILARPVSLELSSKGQRLPLKPSSPSVRVVSAQETDAECRGGLAGQGLAVDVESCIEFDGMMWFAVTLIPRKGARATIDSLVVRIPFRSHNAELVHWWSGREATGEDESNFTAGQQFLGAVPPSEGIVFRSNDADTVLLDRRQRGSFIPYLLLTGMERGLAWFATNDKGWTQSMDVPAVSVVREGEVVTLVLNVISSEIQLAASRKIEFGLHPAPVKKLHPNWRMWPGWGVRADFGGTFRGGPSAWDRMYPPNEDWELPNRLWEEAEDPGVKRMKDREADSLRAFRERYGRDPKPREHVVTGIYTCLPNPGTVPAHTREWEEEWLHRYEYPYRPRPIMTKGFLDFASWCWDQWFKHGLVKGIYVDGSNVRAEWRDTGRYAYTLPDGHVQPGYQWLGVREYLKRMRQASWDNGVVPHICCHMTNQIYIPQLSFVDVMLDGEAKYSHPGKPTDFLDHWPPDRMRVHHIDKWGVIPKWLGWHVQTPRKDGTLAAWEYRQNRAWIANLALHDIQWKFGGPYDEGAAIEFGLRQPDTVYVPYWDRKGLVEDVRVKRVPTKTREDDDGDAAPEQKPPVGPAGTDPIYISAWKRPGKCLVLLVNWSDERLEAEVKLSREAMGLGQGSSDQLRVRDVDTYLIPPATIDYLTLETPDSTGKEVLLKSEDPTDDFDEEAIEEEFKEDEEDALTPEQRRSRHPDAQYAWQNGILRCPVRRHDFRLFVFGLKEN